MTASEQHSDDRAAHHPTRSYPEGTILQIDDSVELLRGVDGQIVLMGGSPLRLLRLRSRARTVVERWRAGGPIASPEAEQRLATRLVDANIAHPRIPPGAGPSAADVTVVIPVHDRAVELDALLTSFGDLCRRVAEVIVVDDGSRDRSGDVAARHGATVIRRGVATGPGAARNAGLERVRTPLTAFVDSDCVASPHWLDALLPHFADQRVAIIAPRVASLADPSVIGRYESVRSALDVGPRPAIVRPGTRVAYVPAAALLARTAVIRELGGFDERMRVGEDVDLIWRTVHGAHDVRYEPASVIHHRARTAPTSFAQRRYAYGTSAGPLDHRHPGQLSPIVLSPWSAAAWVAIATTTPVGIAAGVTIAVGSAAALPAKLAMLADPKQAAWRLASRGHLGAGEQLARSLWRTYLPLTVLAVGASRRARRVAVASLLPYVLDHRRDRQHGQQRDARIPGILSYVSLRLLDDGAYCVGVWRGCIAARTTGPLRPRMQNWPGRRPAAEDGNP